MKRILAFACVVMVAACLPARADEWVAARLRGLVFVEDLAGARQWLPLARGDTVSGTEVVRTLQSGRVTFVNGSQRVEFGANTQARIDDRAGRGRTTVRQDFGSVSVTADVRRVRHFAVETPYLVAVVKGTRFTVTSGSAGARVTVERGIVAVTDRRTGATLALPAGQRLVDTGGGFSVSGRPSGNIAPGEDSGSAPTRPENADAALGGTSGGSEKTLLGGTVSGLGGTIDHTIGTVGGTVGGVAGSLGDSRPGGLLDTAGDSLDDAVTTTTTTLGRGVGGVLGTVGGLLGG